MNVLVYMRVYVVLRVRDTDTVEVTVYGYIMYTRVYTCVFFKCFLKTAVILLVDFAIV